MNFFEAKPKKISKSRVFYILFSIFASILLWLYVAYVENPEKPITISNIRVDYIGAEELVENDLIVTGYSVDSLKIEFRGKRNTLMNLSNSNVYVEVDLTEILSKSVGAGVYTLNYEIKYEELSGNNISVISASSDNVTVTVEKLVTSMVPVRGINNIDVAEGFTAEPLEYSEDTITVSGPQTIVSRIADAWVELNGDETSKTVRKDVSVILRDENGEKIDTENLILSSETVEVTLNVLMVKDVQLSINLVDGASANSANTMWGTDPTHITLSGDPEILNDINQIVLGTIDLTDFALTTTETFNIPIPNGVNNMTGKTTAEVKLQVIGKSTKRLSANNIQVKNTNNLNATIITQSLDITLRGDEKTLDEITADNIRIVADLSALGNNTSGTFSVSAKVYVDGYSDVDAIGTYNVTVSVTR